MGVEPSLHPRNKPHLVDKPHLVVVYNPFIYLFIYNAYLFKVYLFILERGGEGEREGEKHQCVVASHAPPAGDLAHNPGMYPDWESNR